MRLQAEVHPATSSGSRTVHHLPAHAYSGCRSFANSLVAHERLASFAFNEKGGFPSMPLALGYLSPGWGEARPFAQLLFARSMGFKPPVCLLGMGLTGHVHLEPLNGLPPPLDGVRPHIQVNSSWG
ncbi:unnamed protein product [Lepidochelys olivacea]